MADTRIGKLANILVNYSINVKKGERILICGTTLAAPLIKELYRKILQCGAHPITEIELPGMQYIYYKEAQDDQLYEAEYLKMRYQNIDALIRIKSEENLRELTTIDSSRIQKRMKTTYPLLDYLRKDGKRWVAVQYPTPAYAEAANMSLEEYEDFVFGATNIDYSELKQTMLGAAERFKRASKVRIIGKETDITVDITNEKAIICSGNYNVPDGEFFFVPNPLLTEGTIYYEWPTIFSGKEIQGIRLTFEDGKVVQCSADRGQEYLEKALDTDEGSRYLGELGIGMNFGIERPTSNILFDEKIGGSVHLAIGSSHKNVSGIHWDMVKNLRDGGEIYVDGVLIQKNGQWLFE